MSLAQRMLAAFEGSKVAHGTTKVGKVGRNGKAEADSRIVREPLTQKIMQGHIDGEQGIGAIPINEDNKCRWGALDIDIYDLDQNELQARIQKLKLPLLHCRSKSGGAHLYLFLEEYEQASVVREYLLEMTVALGHSGREIFPKQDTILSERGDVGNFINLPYFDAELPLRYSTTRRYSPWSLRLSWTPSTASPLRSLPLRSCGPRSSANSLAMGHRACSICLLMVLWVMTGTRSCSTVVSTAA